jgi:hypothetical protein
MTTLLTLWIVTNFISIVYWMFRFKVLGWMGKEPYDDFKPFTCYFCMANWIGIIASMLFIYINPEQFTTIIDFLPFNFITAYALGKLYDI